MIDLVYIASPSYSGSTLLTFLLHAHPDIATMGELKWGAIDLETYPCSCGALLRECAFWNQVVAKMAERGLPFDLARPATDFRCRRRVFVDRVVRARLRGPLFESARRLLISTLPGLRRDWRTIAATNRAVMGIILELQGGSIFLDASKDPVRASHLLDTGDYRLRLIHLVRDGRAVTHSTMKNQDLPPDAATGEWRRTHGQIERFSRRLPPQSTLRVRYEDLCRDVPGAMARICTWLGVQPVDAPLDFRAAAHHILGNRMRLQAKPDIALDERWRVHLTKSHLAVFEQQGGAMNRAYGYV